MKVRFFYIFLLIFLTSCAGYHFNNNNNNPLIGYDIRTISVPMFINRSVLPQLSGPMTQEIILALKDFSGLRVFNGNSNESDAVLIGIIDSPDHYSDAVKTATSTFTSGDVQKLIGSRAPFYYPSTTAYQFSVKFIIIKRPSSEEIDFVTKNSLSISKLHPKVVLTDDIPVTGSFSRVVSDTRSGGEVNFVKNQGVFEKSLQDSCVQTAKNFKQVVLNAF